MSKMTKKELCQTIADKVDVTINFDDPSLFSVFFASKDKNIYLFVEQVGSKYYIRFCNVLDKYIHTPKTTRSFAEAFEFVKYVFENSGTFRLKKEQAFSVLRSESRYGANFYQGVIRPEYRARLTEKDIADICDDYCQNFGSDVVINPDGSFTCTIYID